MRVESSTIPSEGDPFRPGLLYRFLRCNKGQLGGLGKVLGFTESTRLRLTNGLRSEDLAMKQVYNGCETMLWRCQFGFNATQLQASFQAIDLATVSEATWLYKLSIVIGDTTSCIHTCSIP